MFITYDDIKNKSKGTYNTMFDCKKSKLSTLVGFRATSEERLLLEKIAKEKGLSISNFMRYLVSQYIENSNINIKE